MTTSGDGKAFLQMCLAKRLLDTAQAKDIWSHAQQTAESPQSILVERGLMATHTVQALEKELRRAQGPRVIGGFQLVKQLGQGGMATVFLARQISLGRDVALKVIAPQIAASPEAAERFLREARVAAAINHPNVISIIDVAQADGQLYMALELVPGGDAAQLAARFGGSLPEMRALELLIDCAKGLQALYEARLVHRDLKPSNIFITSEGAAKLGDLGLARSEDGADRMTATGHPVGTPAFMSPEQAGGDGTVDIRSDIYALGATLFALVTGRQPFVANSPIAVAAKTLIEPAPDPRSLAPHLSAAIAKLILRAMAKSAAERFQTPRELREALEQALNQLPQTTPRPAARTSAISKPAEQSTPATNPGTRRGPTRVPRPRRVPGFWFVLAAVVLAMSIAIAVIFLSGLTQTPALINKPASDPTLASSTTIAPPPKPSTATPVPEPLGTVSTVAATVGIDASPPPGINPPRVPWATAQGRDTFGHWILITVKGIQQRLRWLPPGTSVVGSPPGEVGRFADNEAQSTVTFTYGSWLADTECTQALWQAMTGRNPSSLQDPRFPVTQITVADAIAFTRTLRPLLGGARVRLPSRAEWERACRAGTTTTYATGNDVRSLKGYANLFDQDRATAFHQDRGLPLSDGFVGVAPVASFKPNRWGYHDMHGNVLELCLGKFESLPPICSDPLTDDEPSAQIGFIRGGGFNSEGPIVYRVAAIPYLGRDAANAEVGFRFLIEGR